MGGGGTGARRRRGEDRGPRQQGPPAGAESFVDGVPAGSTEFARIETAFDEGKKHDSVVIHQAGPDYYAVRQGDAGAAKLIAPAVTDILTALDATQKAPDATQKK